MRRESRAAQGIAGLLRWLRLPVVMLAISLCGAPALAQLQMRSAASPPPPQVVVRAPAFSGDYIVAVVNSELVTAAEVEQRIERLRAAAAGRGGPRAPVTEQMREQALESLIEERVLLTYARDSGLRLEEAEIDRAVQSVAAQNSLTIAQLRERLAADGIDYARFRANLRDQILLERVREREVGQRTRVTDAEIDKYLAERNAISSRDSEINIAQILIPVPEGADAELLAQRKARADTALQRVRGGEDFAVVAREMSEDSNRARGGEIGLRPASRLPDLFVEQVRGLRPGEVSPTLLRSGAGFHVLKLVERRDTTGMRITQTRARHILLRPSPQLSVDLARQRLSDMRAQIERGSSNFESLARQFSEDSSAAQGGDLGWANPGAFVPEFEDAMNRLPVGGLSQPVVTRFGVHLIEVVERRETTLDVKQVREQASNAVREQKYEQAYLDWVKDLRGRAYVELRDPP
jgi:peptidyl-prolyl cis-trans isomerase SurA